MDDDQPLRVENEALRRRIAEVPGQLDLTDSKRALDETAALLRATRVVVDEPEFLAAARAVFGICRDLVGATAGYVALLGDDGTTNDVLFFEAEGQACGVDTSLPMPIRGLRAEAYQAGRAVFDNAFARSPHLPFVPRGHVSLASVLFAPLLVSGRIMGLMGFANKPGGFTERDARMAEAFGELVALALDRTRSAQALGASQASLIKADRLASLGLLAAGVAHEINNPMTIVMNCAELICDDVPPESPIAANARSILDASQRVTAIVRSLLAFSRQEKDHHSPARIPDIIERTMSLVRKLLQKDQIRVEIELPEDLPSVTCRTNQIAQVLMNLLTNARDALNARYPGAHADKIVAISAAPALLEGRPGVRVTVEDHGVGIPEGILERIFDPFFTTKARDQGSGLGLSLSLGFVQEHGGRLWAESRPGQVTRFHVELPVAYGGE